MLEVRALLLSPNAVLGEVPDDLIPVRVLAVELSQPFVDAGYLKRHERRGVSECILSGAGEAADELERDGETLLRVVDGGDLERGEIEPFAEHIHADHDSARAVEQCVTA